MLICSFKICLLNPVLFEKRGRYTSKKHSNVLPWWSVQSEEGRYNHTDRKSCYRCCKERALWRLSQFRNASLDRAGKERENILQSWGLRSSPRSFEEECLKLEGQQRATVARAMWGQQSVDGWLSAQQPLSSQRACSLNMFIKISWKTRFAALKNKEFEKVLVLVCAQAEHCIPQAMCHIVHAPNTHTHTHNFLLTADRHALVCM